MGPNGALAASRALVAEGRGLDAIALLSDANRAAPDAEIERSLVALRHEAFDALPRTPPTTWRPITAAPRVSTALPEIPPDELTPATLRAGLSQHGYVLVRGLVGPARVEKLVDGIDRALAAFDANRAGAPASETAPWYVEFEPRRGELTNLGPRNWVRASGGVWTVDSPRMLFELCELIEELGIGELVEQYLGERPAFLAIKSTLRRVEADATGDWHQDGAFLGVGSGPRARRSGGEKVHSVNLWLSLSECGRDAPGLDIIPRRFDHLVESGTEGAAFDWVVSPKVAARLAEEVPIVRPEFGPGDALLFDQMFLHRTASDPSMTRARYAIETWFFAPSTYPHGQVPLVY